MEELFLRDAQEKDANGIMQVHVDGIQKVCSSKYSKDQVQKWVSAQSRSEYLSWITTAEHFLVVANKEDDIFGFAYVAKCSPDKFSSNMDFEVHKLYVSPAKARRGIGRKLLEELERRVSNDGGRGLAVKSSLNAVPFYEACGYQWTGVDDVVRVGEALLECSLLEKPICHQKHQYQ